MGGLVKLFLPALCVVLSFFVYWGQDSIWPAWCFLTFGSFLLWADSADESKDNCPASVQFLLIWVLFSSLLLVEFKPLAEGAGISIPQTLLIKNLSATALLEFLSGFLFFQHFGRQYRAGLGLGFYMAGLLNTFSLIYDQFILHIPTGTAAIGLLGNRSMGASFTATWVLFSFHYADYFPDIVIKAPGSRPGFRQWPLGLFIKPLAALGVVAIALSSSGISYIALLFGAATFLWLVDPGLWVAIVVMIITGLGLGEYVKPEFNTHLSRYDAWGVFWRFWRANFNPFFGSGLGTFRLWGPAAQMAEHFREDKGWWLWAHNDWFQTMFELGAVGLSLATWCLVSALKRCRQRPALFSSLVAFAVVAMGNYPLRLAPFAFFAWFLGYEAFFGQPLGEFVPSSEPIRPTLQGYVGMLRAPKNYP
jgi:hypothetical protein